MLILMRRPGETIFIGEEITVTVLAVDRNRVRLGIKAPKSTRVDREEIRAKKMIEGQRSAVPVE